LNVSAEIDDHEKAYCAINNIAAKVVREVLVTRRGICVAEQKRDQLKTQSTKHILGYIPSIVAPFSIRHGRKNGGKERVDLLGWVLNERRLQVASKVSTYEVFEHEG
jgi:hypothetical protein